MPDFLPKDKPSLVLWLGNYQTKLATYGPTLGLTPAEITAVSTACAEFSTLVNNVKAAKAVRKNALEAKNAGKDSDLTLIRKANNKMKVSDAYTDAIGKDMGIKAESQEPDREAAKPKFSGEAFPDYVRLKFTKNGLDGVNIYSRLKLQPAWAFLSRDTNSPYDDHKPLANGAPETMEYMCIGVKT
jgi:hypothetical protein